MKRFNQYVKALRWTLAIVMCVVCSGSAWAASTKYYEAKALVSPTGTGTAYVSKTNGNYTQTSVSGDEFGSGAQTVNLYFKVTPDANHELDHWEDANGSSVGNDNPLVRTNLSYSGSQNDPTLFIYTAVLRNLNSAVNVQVAPGEESRGSVSINPSDNDINSNVTLTATPRTEDGMVFLGWTKDEPNGTNYISNAGATYSFTVSNNNKGTYYAHFRELGKSFVRLQNVKTGKFLSLYGNAAATAHNYNGENNNPDGFTFNGSLKMISETDAQGNPMTVFMRMGTNGNDFTEGNLKAAGVAYNTLVNSASYPLTMHKKANNGNYVIYTTHNVKTKKFYIKYNNDRYLNRDGHFTYTKVEWEIDDDGYISTMSGSTRLYLYFDNNSNAKTDDEPNENYKFAIDNDNHIYQIDRPQYYIKQFKSGSIRYGYLTDRTYTMAGYDEFESTADKYSFLCDEGSDYPVMKTLVTKTSSKYKDAESAPEGAEWTIYELKDGETTGAFGANTKAKFTDGKGKYYTTMFSYFPYQLGSGVRAYYLPLSEGSYDEEKNTVTFTEITGNVPANTAVVLECDAVQNANGEVDNVKNILTPLTGTVEALPNGNLLKGYTSLNGSTVSNDKEKMYVLSVNSNGKLGFYHSNNANMAANKAYLEMIDIVEQTYPQAKNATFSFGDIDDEEEGTVTGITVATENNGTDAPIYDLSGRKVENPSRGIYIRNKKKFVVK